MNKLTHFLQNEFKNTPDLITKTININHFNIIYIMYIETISSSNRVNDYILKELVNNKDKINKNNIESFIAGPNCVQVENKDKCQYYLTNGYTLVIIKDKIIAVETKADLTRAIEGSTVESSINGPKDSFTENIQTNIGLIKRRIKSNTLKTENKVIGRKTLTAISLLYFEDITDRKIINNIK